MTTTRQQQQQQKVIVVGGGLAGLSAAHTVLENGGAVLLLDKSAFLGGNSTKATSGINGMFSFLDGDFFSLSLSLSFFLSLRDQNPSSSSSSSSSSSRKATTTRRGERTTRLFSRVLKRCDEIVVASKKI